MCSRPGRGRDVLQRQLQRRRRQRRRSSDRRMLAHCPLTSRACMAHRSLYVVDAGLVRASAKGCGVAQQRIAATVERRTHSLYDAYASFRAWPATGAPVCAHVDVTDELKSQSASLYLEENSSHSFPAPRGCTSRKQSALFRRAARALHCRLRLRRDGWRSYRSSRRMRFGRGRRVLARLAPLRRSFLRLQDCSAHKSGTAASDSSVLRTSRCR